MLILAGRRPERCSRTDPGDPDGLQPTHRQHLDSAGDPVSRPCRCVPASARADLARALIGRLIDDADGDQPADEGTGGRAR